MIGDFIEAVRTTLNIDTDRWAIGAFHIGANKAAPRYVWVPTRDSIEPWNASGAFGSRSPRGLYVRYAGLECHVWGATLEQTETMVHGIIAASKANLGADVEQGGVQWPPVALNQSGVLAVVSLGVPIPITADAIESVTTGTFDTIECDDEPTIPADGFVECCEEIDP